MKQIGQLMKEIGFNKDSSEDTQKAFIKNLIRQANQFEKISIPEVEASPPRSKANNNLYRNLNSNSSGNSNSCSSLNSSISINKSKKSKQQLNLFDFANLSSGNSCKKVG